MIDGFYAICEQPWTKFCFSRFYQGTSKVSHANVKDLEFVILSNAVQQLKSDSNL